jgi:hypothetical protein
MEKTPSKWLQEQKTKVLLPFVCQRFFARGFQLKAKDWLESLTKQWIFVHVLC